LECAGTLISREAQGESPQSGILGFGVVGRLVLPEAQGESVLLRSRTLQR